MTDATTEVPTVPAVVGFTQTLIDVPVNKCKTPRYGRDKRPINPRRYGSGAVSIDDLVESMPKAGLKQRIIVMRDPNNAKEYWILDGDRRWTAAKALGWKTIPAILLEGEFNESDVVEFMLLSDVRKHLHPSGVAYTIKLMVQADPSRWTFGSVGKALGKNPHEIELLLKLADSPLKVQEQVDAFYSTDGTKGISLTGFKALMHKPKAVQEAIVDELKPDDSESDEPVKAPTVDRIKRVAKKAAAAAAGTPVQPTLGDFETMMAANTSPALVHVNDALAWLRSNKLPHDEWPRMQTVIKQLSELVGIG